jgi:hypothetical protein
MDIFNPHSKSIHDGTEIVAKKKHEYKFLGTHRKPHANSKLWAYDPDSGYTPDQENVYEIKIMVKEAYDIVKDKDRATQKADINPKHIMIWAINKKNAIRKFKMYALKK